MALRNLTRRKLRAALTILGVLIGTTSIVVMLSIGLGLNHIVTGDAEDNGRLNTIKVRPKRNDDVRKRNQEYKRPVITDDNIKEILSDPNIKAATPFDRVDAQTKYEKYSMWADVYAVKPETLALFNFEVERGRMINNSDKLQVVVGGRLQEQLFDENARRSSGPREAPDVDFLGKKIQFSFYKYDNSGGKKKPKTYDFEVVGVLKSGDWEKDSAIFVSYEYFAEFIEKLERKYNKEEYMKNRKNPVGYEEVRAYMLDMKQAEETIARLEEMGYRAYSEARWINETKKQMAVVQAVLGGIGGISLLVAAIGITNTMIMSIYERTKEIGVMKVIGANIKDIKRLFLIEAAFIGFWGGIVGLGASYGLSTLINKLAVGFVEGFSRRGDVEQKISIIPLWLVLLAIGFSTLIGLISGYLPARRAMKLSALRAIRTE